MATTMTYAINGTEHKFEIKKVSECKALSDETPCFVADLYIDNKKIGNIRNDGHGGPDIVDYTTPELQKMWYPHENELTMIVYKLLDKRDADAYVKRNQKNKLLYLKGTVIHNISFKNGLGKAVSIADALKIDRNMVQIYVDKYKAEGCTILNTNLDGININ